MAIRGEQTGTEELIKDGIFLWAAVLSDPETQQLAKPVRQTLDLLKTADLATRAAEETVVEKAALLERSEYLHDDLQRECELDVLKQRSEGALLTLFPGDRARVRSYFRDHKSSRRAAESPTTPLEPTTH